MRRMMNLGGEESLVDEIEIIKIDGARYINDLRDKKLPKHLSRRLTNSVIGVDFTNFSDGMVHFSGFTSFDEDFIVSLADLLAGEKVLEVMSGLGSFAKCLQDFNVDILPTDDFSWINQKKYVKWTRDMCWTDIKEMDAIKAIEEFGKDVNFVICSWIPYMSRVGYDLVKKLYEVNPKAILIHIGDSDGGCTGDFRFWKSVEEISITEKMRIGFDLVQDVQNSYKSFMGRNDRVTFLRYNPKSNIKEIEEDYYMNNRV